LTLLYFSASNAQLSLHGLNCIRLSFAESQLFLPSVSSPGCGQMVRRQSAVTTGQP
jgi:hypothetical protein